MILDEILSHKRTEVAQRRAALPLSALESRLRDAPPARAFAATLRQDRSVPADAPGANGPEVRPTADPSVLTRAPLSEVVPRGSVPTRAPLSEVVLRGSVATRASGVAIIAEIKRKSPSAGALQLDVSVEDLAASYASGGASALSILTDQEYFGGSDADLQTARAATELPVLRKDFVVDPYQVYEARALGADAVLLIVRALSQVELTTLLALSRELDLAALVETHSAAEVQQALDAGATIVGVNNRDLDTLTTDPSLALRLRGLVPRECIFVAESGVSQPEQVAALAEVGADAVLIGESLLRSSDPTKLLQTLLAAGQRVGARP